MTTIDVDLTHPTGGAAGDKLVTVELIAGPTGAAHHDDSEILGAARHHHTNPAGHLSLDLVPNANLEPDGTFYRIRSGGATWNITVPATGGPYDLGDPAIQVVTPVPPDWVPLEGPPGEMPAIDGDDVPLYVEAELPATLLAAVEEALTANGLDPAFAAFIAPNLEARIAPLLAGIDPTQLDDATVVAQRVIIMLAGQAGVSGLAAGLARGEAAAAQAAADAAALAAEQAQTTADAALVPAALDVVVATVNRRARITEHGLAIAPEPRLLVGRSFAPGADRGRFIYEGTDTEDPLTQGLGDYSTGILFRTRYQLDHPGYPASGGPSGYAEVGTSAVFFDPEPGAGQPDRFEAAAWSRSPADNVGLDSFLRAVLPGDAAWFLEVLEAGQTVETEWPTALYVGGHPYGVPVEAIFAVNFNPGRALILLGYPSAWGPTIDGVRYEVALDVALGRTLNFWHPGDGGIEQPATVGLNGPGLLKVAVAEWADIALNPAAPPAPGAIFAAATRSLHAADYTLPGNSATSIADRKTGAQWNADGGAGIDDPTT